jgi:hypothetical protein
VTKYWLKNEYQSFKETCSSSFLKMENSFLWNRLDCFTQKTATSIAQSCVIIYQQLISFNNMPAQFLYFAQW